MAMCMAGKVQYKNSIPIDSFYSKTWKQASLFWFPISSEVVGVVVVGCLLCGSFSAQDGPGRAEKRGPKHKWPL